MQREGAFHLTSAYGAVKDMRKISLTRLPPYYIIAQHLPGKIYTVQ
jgi:hypothetical protein